MSDNIIKLDGNPWDGTDGTEDANPNVSQFVCKIVFNDGPTPVEEVLNTVLIAGFTSEGNFRWMTNKMSLGQLLEILERVKKQAMDATP